MSAPANRGMPADPDADGGLLIRGADGAKFLQGQLSSDMEALEPGGHTLAGLHNPQGRAIAVLAITRISAEEFRVALPRELADVVSQRLRKFILRAKVSIETTPPAEPSS